MAPPSRTTCELLTAKALLGRDLRRFFRQPSRVVGSLAQPLVLWAALGAGFGRSFEAPGPAAVSYLEYFYPGIVVLTVLFTAIFSTISLIDDRQHGFLQAVLAAPASPVALVAGKTAGGTAIALLQAGVLVTLAPLAGFDLAAVAWVELALVLTLGAVAFTALGFAMAWWIDSTQGYHAVMSVLLIPLWMLSGAMYPARAGSTVMDTLMRLDPMTYVVSGTRRALYGSAPPAGLFAEGSLSWDLSVTAAAAGLAVAAAIVLSRRRA